MTHKRMPTSLLKSAATFALCSLYLTAPHAALALDNITVDYGTGQDKKATAPVVLQSAPASESTQTTTPATTGEAPRLVWVEGPKGQSLKGSTASKKPTTHKYTHKKTHKAAAPKVVEKAAVPEEVVKAPPAPVAPPAVHPAPPVAPPAPPVAPPAPPVTPHAAMTPPPPPAGAVAPPPSAGAVPPPPPPVIAAPPPPPPVGAVPPPPPPVGAVPPPPPAGAVPPPPPPPPAPPAPAAEHPAIMITPPPAAPAAPVAPAKPEAKAPEAPAIPAVNPAVNATEKAMEAPKPAAAATGTPSMSIEFKATETSVPLSVSEPLNKLAKQLIQNESQRLTLIAYASSSGDQVSTARRVSLSRALSVRAFLIDAGVANLRINVQAEGDKNPGGNPDRVDLFVATAEQPK